GVERERVKLAAGQRAVARDPIGMCPPALARQRLAQRNIVRPQVARRELRRLVLDRVGLEIRHGLGSVRDAPILAQSCGVDVTRGPAPKKSPAPGGAQGSRCGGSGLGGLHAGSLRTLRALGDLVADALAFLQAAEALGLDRREVHEDIRAAVLGCDEAEALGVVEPFHCAVLHDSPYLVWMRCTYAPCGPPKAYACRVCKACPEVAITPPAAHRPAPAARPTRLRRWPAPPRA